MSELSALARASGVDPTGMRRAEIIFALVQADAPDGGVAAEGVLETTPECGFLRSIEAGYLPAADDVYVSPSQIRRFGLRTGDKVRGLVRPPKESERFLALTKVSHINDLPADEARERATFENLTPIHPNRRFVLAGEGGSRAMRLIELFAPLGRGQRCLVVAPPRTGKTVLLQDLARALVANQPEIELLVLLVDERPEEVTEMRRTVRGEVLASTFDEEAAHHVQVAEMVLERAKRLVEHGKDVVVLLDSITRLARAYNTVAPSSGKVLSGGVDAHALHKPKRFFGAARNAEEGGSLTLVATALVDTGSRMDEVIFEEFKGTGSSEIHLDRKLMDRRMFPCLDVQKSGTRREELLVEPNDLPKIWALRHALSTMSQVEALELLFETVDATPDQRAFLQAMAR